MNQAPTTPASKRRLLVLQVCSALAASGLWAQAVPEETTPSESQTDEILTLSPFTVDTSQDKGYFAENTLAGSRMRTNISDLGAAITVVTKQQMEDTASLDINDVFRYEIGTEGSTTYTPTTTTMRGDGVADAIGGASFGNSTTTASNATANRIRGLGSPTMSLNYYPAISAIPFDSYNTSSVEISRGPNSMLFGMGSPAGIVNQSTASAVLNKKFANVTIRLDDRDSDRASLSFNQPLIEDKLAVYGAFLYDNKQFERKPSYDISRRQYGAITFRPFSKTTIKANVEGYSNDNRRPNTLTPIDGVSEWRAAGRPVYNSLSKMVTYLDSGLSSGPYVTSAASPDAQRLISYVNSIAAGDPLWNPTNNTYNGVSIFSTSALTDSRSILYVPGMTFQNQARAIQRIADGQLVDWYQPQGGIRQANGWGANSAGTTYPFSTSSSAADYVYGNATWADIYNRYTTSSALWSGPNATTEMKNYRYPGVTDQSIYDWENINISQANFGSQRNTNYNVELDQEILPSLLQFNAGWFRQDYDSMQSYTISQLNSAQLFVDTNEVLPDGSANPYFGQVYVEDFEPDRFSTSKTVDNYRAMLAFTPDFTQNKGWTRWLGRHQILGLASRMEDDTTAFRYRLQYVDGSDAGKYAYMRNPLPNAQGQETGWNMQNTSVRRQYYLSRPGEAQGRVTTASGAWDNARETGYVTAYNYATQQFEQLEVVTDWNVHEAGTQKNQRRLNSFAAGWTSYFWDDRIIGTLGIRRDVNSTRQTTNAGMTNQEKWVDGLYQYDDVFSRWTEWNEVSDNTHTVGAVVKPFKGWGPIARRAATGNAFWEIIDSLGFSYNESTNFDAPTTTMVDLFNTPLPAPRGEGKDWGFQFSAFDNKLFARVNWYEATNENAVLGGTSTTALDRLAFHTDTTAFRSWLETIYIINQGYDPTVENWRQDFDNDPAQVAAMEQQVSEWWGLPYNYYTSLSGTKGGTGTTTAEGVEVAITYNPTRNWTVKFTGSKNTTVNSNLMKEFDAWYAERAPVWDGAQATDYLLPQYAQYANGYTNFGGRNVVLGEFWNSTNYNSTIQDDSTNGWTTARNYYNAVVTPQYMLAKDLEGQIAPGQRRYNWTVLSNYVFDRGSLKGFSMGGAQRWADKSIIGYYGKASGADPANPGVIDLADTSRPIHDDAIWYTDLWIGYTRKILENKVRMKLQLNVNDVFQDGELKPVAVNYDGTPYAYRIVDSRQFILTASFDF